MKQRPGSCPLTKKKQQKGIKSGDQTNSKLLYNNNEKPQEEDQLLRQVMQHSPRNKIMDSSVHQVEL